MSMSTSTKSIVAAVLALSLTFALTGCGSGGGSTTANTQTPQTPGTMSVPPGADPATWKPTATIISMTLPKNTYSTSTPAQIDINYGVSIETTPQGGSAILHAGLSNSPIVPVDGGICELTKPAPTQYQDLGAAIGSTMLSLVNYKVNAQMGTFTSSPASDKLIMPTPINGINYTQPTYIILTLCVPDNSKLPINGVQPYTFSQASQPITIK